MWNVRPLLGTGPPAVVKIDGRRPSELPGVLSLTRTTSYPGSGWPCILRIGCEKPWQAVPHFVDEFVSPGVKDPAAETTVTLAQGFPNGRHRLEIAGGPNLPIAAVRVYRPPLAEK